ncbi:MAG: sigma 54-interacting transcriptional regulator [Lachnospiraceae bacterium]|nr:sigma 54-interacting transcriptional regulator [Lachnospiraceae bacterium]
MSESNRKYHVLIVCINPYIRIEFQNYLYACLGDYVSFDTSDLASIISPDQLKDYQCILFSSIRVQSDFPVPIPDSIAQIICTRTFNHAYLDQIIRIPPNEKVYVVNDLMDSTIHVIQAFQEYGLTQYQFIPYAGDPKDVDPSVRYAITVGEPQMVPKHVRNIINIGNRIIDISTINELCVLFHLPAELGNRITKNYVSHIMKAVKTAGSYYSSFVFSQQLLLAATSNLPLSICLLDENGIITLANKQFANDWELPENGVVGKTFSHSLPEAFSSIPFNLTADYSITNRSGIPMNLSVMELSFPNHASMALLTSKPDPSREPDSDLSESSKWGGQLSPIERQRSTFMNLITASKRCQEMLSYAKRLSLYDFPILIQGESGTQKKMLAKAIHQSSSRRNQPFVSFNQMMSLSSSTPLEILDAADHGTLLIDSIERLPFETQDFLVQLLQNISNSTFRSQESYDIRIIATSSADLYALVQEGAFRQDLFFQLSMAVIDTIPLKNRKEDIPLLLEHFFQNMFHDPKFHLETILSKSLYQFLLTYDYPGNVQELMNLAQYFFSMYAAHPLILSQLPSYIRSGLSQKEGSQSMLKRQVLALIKNMPRSGRAAIQKALAESGTQISDGKLRGLLKELSDQELILVHRTKGGCEITEAGIAMLAD